ncbi:MAG: NAD(P)/FAD-dependent oxidoreductase [Firmicutes bacterium]|nr:NAD(P)/FAD-dependent oxidoreductase [Bacillota bacterium]
MRVAIIGAGPSGLACALALEQRGIAPDIFERSYRVGLPAPAVGIMMQLFGRPERDQVRCLAEKFGLPLNPLSKLKRVVMRTSRRAVAVTGDLGYLMERGQGPNSVEVQLAEQLRAKIKYDIQADHRTLAAEYDSVVVADGAALAARDLKVWETTVSAWVKGVVLLGRFDPGTAVLYFDTGYARHGFGFMAPFSNRRAVLMLIVPDIERTELSTYWDRFLDREKFHPEIIESFELHHVSGFSTRQRVNNIFMVGNSGGFTDSFLGHGLFAGMSGGALAARAIAEGLDFERMVAPIMRQMARLQIFREAFNTMDNAGIDRLVRILTLPGVARLVYNTNVDVSSLASPFIEQYLRVKKAYRPAAKKNP